MGARKGKEWFPKIEKSVSSSDSNKVSFLFCCRLHTEQQQYFTGVLSLLKASSLGSFSYFIGTFSAQFVCVSICFMT